MRPLSCRRSELTVYSVFSFGMYAFQRFVSKSWWWCAKVWSCVARCVVWVVIICRVWVNAVSSESPTWRRRCFRLVIVLWSRIFAFRLYAVTNVLIGILGVSWVASSLSSDGRFSRMLCFIPPRIILLLSGSVSLRIFER